MQATGVRLETAYVDLGYRGGDQDNPGIEIKHRGKFKSLPAEERTLLKRRQAIEPIIGHFKGAEGDSPHAVPCAAGYNIRWLLRMIIKKISTFFHARFRLASWGHWLCWRLLLCLRCFGDCSGLASSDNR